MIRTIENKKTIETTYTGDRYELAKLMVETNQELRKIADSIGGTEKLAQVIYDPEMDHDESFTINLLEHVLEGKAAEFLTKSTQETIHDSIKDITKTLPLILDESSRKLIESTKENLSSLSQDQVLEELSKLQKEKNDLDTLKADVNLHPKTTDHTIHNKESLSSTQIRSESIDSTESMEILCDTAPVELAKSYLGTKEGTDQADIFVKSFVKGNSKKVPWCAGFVSYCLKQTGHKFTKYPLRAKSYIGKMGPGHIAFWDEDAGKMIAGNYGNKVAYQKLPKTYKWNTPEEIDKGNYEGFAATTPEDIPNGAIIVMNRSSSDNNMI